MAKPLTQAQLDAIWRAIDANPDAYNREIARRVGLSVVTVWKVRREGQRVAHEQRTFTSSSGLWVAPKVKPKHVKSEQFSRAWWDENDRAFCDAMGALMEAAE